MKNFVFAFFTFLVWAILSALAHQKLFSVVAELKPTDSLNILQSAVKEPVYKDTLKVKTTKIDSVVALPINKTYLTGTIYFGVNQDKFKELNKIDSLTKVLKWVLLNNQDAHLYIEGHTDSIGQVETNYSIGLERANIFKGYLSSQGIDALRIETSSKGETAPKYENSNIEHFKNRRLELTVKTFKNN